MTRTYKVVLEDAGTGERRTFVVSGNIRKTAVRVARRQWERETGIMPYTRVVSVAPTKARGMVR